jgi:hypothetical protein
MESICAGRGENTVRSGRRFVFGVFEKDNYGVATEAIRAAIAAFPIPVGPPARPCGEMVIRAVKREPPAAYPDLRTMNHLAAN